MNNDKTLDGQWILEDKTFEGVNSVTTIMLDTHPNIASVEQTVYLPNVPKSMTMRTQHVLLSKELFLEIGKNRGWL